MSTCIVSTEGCGIPNCRYFLWKLQVCAHSVCTRFSPTGLWEAVKVEEYLCKAPTRYISDCRRGRQTGCLPVWFCNSRSLFSCAVGCFSVTSWVAKVSKSTKQIMLPKVFLIVVLLHFFRWKIFLNVAPSEPLKFFSVAVTFANSLFGFFPQRAKWTSKKRENLIITFVLLWLNLFWFCFS